MKNKFYFLAVAVIMAAVFSGCKKEEPIAPTVVTKTAYEITKVSATLKGEITNEGSDPITTCGFYYDSVPDMSYPMVLESKLNGNTFTASLTELNPGTTYYYRAYAISNAGTAEGEIVRFATVSAVAPTVLTVSVSDINATGATLNGNITAEGSDPVTERGFIYGTSETNLSQQAECGSGTGTFSKPLTNLSVSTTYYFKAYATSDAGTSYGEVESFTTLAPTAPTVETSAATNITRTEANLNGNVTSDGGAMVTTRGFIYGTNQNNLTQNITCGTGTGNMTYNLTGLTKGTRYYFKAYATNSEGTTYGEIKTFLTDKEICIDFETGNFSQAAFTFSSNYPWVVTANSPYEGTYCMKSTNNGYHSTTSYIELPINCSTTKTISFYVKVSSESYYDKFLFYIDNVAVSGQLSGEVTYRFIQYTLPQGSHTLKWEYRKDYSNSNGNDCAYVDKIVID